MKLVLFFVRLELMMSKGVFDEKREVIEKRCLEERSKSLEL
jgi:hypothetical protein